MKKFIVPMLLSAAAGAQPGDRLEEVQVTAGRIEQAVSDVSTAVTVIDADEIRSQAPAISTDLLRGVPGAFVQQTTPGQGVPIVRGLKGSEVLHLVDGFRLNNALFRNAPNQYVALVDARSLARLEVVRGPAPALYGSDAMGGVVQMVTELPQLDIEPALSGRAVFDYQTADEALTGHLTVSQGGRRAAMLASATYQDVGDRRVGGGAEPGNSAYTSRAGRAVFVARPDDRHDLMLDLQYLRQPGTPRFDELVAGFGQDQPASAVFSFEPNDRLFLHARHQWHEVGGFIDELETHLGYQVMHDDRRTRDTGSTSLRRERNKSELIGLTVQAQSRTGIHQLTYGAEIYADEVSSSRTATDINSGTTESIRSRFPTGSTMDSIAFYINDSFALGSRLDIDVGARYSQFDISLPPADRPIGTDVDVDDLTGDLGLIYEIQPNLSLVANIGRGFRAPNIFDLGTLGPRPGNRFNIGNPNLGPEEVLTTDIGFKWSSATVVAEAVVWQADYRDKIDSVPTGEIDESGRTIVQSRNTAELDLWGIESGLRYRSGDGRFGVEGVINYTRGEQTDADGFSQPGDRIPPLNGLLAVSYGLSPEIGVDAAVRFAADQERISDRDAGDPRIDPNGTAGWAVFDLGLQWQVSAALDARLWLDNVMDKRYREHASGIDAPGRSLGLSLSASF
ncbi:MAG: TonB-dependent receptor [Gammaproteobacteria bacterium]|nr:TonB-dependent receptor [Gammaproteobacteria bacterium]